MLDFIRLKDSVLSLCPDGEESVDVYIGKDGVNSLRFMLASTRNYVFSWSTDEWELFFGPYIDGNETGYIFQAINRVSRRVTSVSVPFTEGFGFDDVKERLNAILR